MAPICRKSIRGEVRDQCVDTLGRQQRVVSERPRTARIQPLGHDEQSRFDGGITKRELFAEYALEIPDQRGLVVPRPQDAVTQPVLAKHLASKTLIVGKDLVDGHPQSRGRRR